MMMNPYLTFNGDCEAAFNFYKSVFKKDFDMFQRFSDMPSDCLPQEKDLVMHVSLPIAEKYILMGSDASSHSGDIVMGSNFSISLQPDSKEQADQLFSALSQSGNVIMGLQDMFWGAYYGICIDKFGIQWMINVPTN